MQIVWFCAHHDGAVTHRSAAPNGGYRTLALSPLVTRRDKGDPSLDGFLQSESQTAPAVSQTSVTPSRSWRLIYSLTWEFAPISQCMLAGFPAFVGGFGAPAERKPHVDRAFHDHPPT